MSRSSASATAAAAAAARTLDIAQHTLLNLAGVFLILLCSPAALLLALGPDALRNSDAAGTLAHLSWIASEYLTRLESRHLSSLILGRAALLAQHSDLSGGGVSATADDMASEETALLLDPDFIDSDTAILKESADDERAAFLA
ncbi:hypothetical protein OC834_000605 [Tilletia horrida]|nr:hypothetical protein OC834_000605 [Tilletia horrida]